MRNERPMNQDLRLRVMIVVPTFRRVRLLTELLHALGKQDAVFEPLELRAIVLDNDPERSAFAVIRDLGPTFPFPLEYENVIQAGLATIRNRALDVARGACDVLAMIDDDECPEPQWLGELLAVHSRTSATAVVGPVPSTIPVGAPRWLHDFRKRELPVFADGATLSDGWSGNCLLDMKAVTALGVRFDREFNFAGGEDQLFFREIVARGGRIAYAARAVAWEDLPAERQSLRFVFKRSFRRGNTLALCDRRLMGRLLATPTRFLKALVSIARGAAKIIYSIVRRDASRAIDGACDVVSACGMISGVAGLTYQAYRRPVEIAATAC